VTSADQDRPDRPVKPLAIVTGVGPGTGAHVVRRFHAGGYQVAMLARKAERLDALAEELPDAFACPCDVTDTAALTATLESAERRAGGPPKVVVHNAVGGAFGNFLDIDPAVLERNFQVNVMALLHLARWAAPRMEPAGGALIVTGNTASLRGRAGFAGFAPTKAAQRILAEAIAREMGPRGVHVAFLVIDAAIYPFGERRRRHADKPVEFFTQPADLAEEIWHLAHQPRSAWSFLSEVRPFGETW
jgi:NAD(P)-dependent dehydrogenase (short-subunit alcohol dehydrogenase family)